MSSNRKGAALAGASLLYIHKENEKSSKLFRSYEGIRISELISNLLKSFFIAFLLQDEVCAQFWTPYSEYWLQYLQNHLLLFNDPLMFSTSQGLRLSDTSQ
jgi:hypothetical protein